ncbi:MAG: 7,8-didemethyl-8-hydroxy-5-deazariboflavin synthase CofG [Polyangiaceae bacterium]|nr:7,8-didemethyl-8-hydroxy-5-deazariboflavin synthase CofG [Polyangiaceae bacterium]
MSAPLLSDSEALGLAGAGEARILELMREAAALRDRAWGRALTFSPKVFLPLTNLCRNHCDYCSFRRSPGDPGEWTMTPSEVEASLAAAAAAGCSEALFCLGDNPDSAFPAYRRTLARFGHDDTVAYLEAGARAALRRGLLPHTNAGVLDREALVRLRRVNPSLGLMLESSSPRLCDRGMPHHRAPDKRPSRRLRMLDEAGALRIPMTTGVLIGIGETRRERVESLLALRALHARHGHLQELIVQNFTPRPEIALADRGEAGDLEMAHAVALARLLLPPEVSVQSPPNLNPTRTALLLSSGINDLGGISPVTADYVNPRHPWPVLAELARTVAREGFELRPRAAIYPAFVATEGWLDPALRGAVLAEQSRLARLGDLAAGAALGRAEPSVARGPAPAEATQ